MKLLRLLRLLWILRGKNIHKRTNGTRAWIYDLWIAILRGVFAYLFLRETYFSHIAHIAHIAHKRTTCPQRFIRGQGDPQRNNRGKTFPNRYTIQVSPIYAKEGYKKMPNCSTAWATWQKGLVAGSLGGSMSQNLAPHPQIQPKG